MLSTNNMLGYFGKIPLYIYIYIYIYICVCVCVCVCTIHFVSDQARVQVRNNLCH